MKTLLCELECGLWACAQQLLSTGASATVLPLPSVCWKTEAVGRWWSEGWMVRAGLPPNVSSAGSTCYVVGTPPSLSLLGLSKLTCTPTASCPRVTHFTALENTAGSRGIPSTAVSGGLCQAFIPTQKVFGNFLVTCCCGQGFFELTG